MEPQMAQMTQKESESAGSRIRITGKQRRAKGAETHLRHLRNLRFQTLILKGAG